MRFRYVVSTSGPCPLGHFSLNVTIQLESGRGALLKVEGILTRDRWLDFPEIECLDKYPVLTPGDIAVVIRRARARGWNPAEIGVPFILAITSDEFR